MIYVAGLIVFIPLIAGGILALASRKERAATRVTYMALGTSPSPAPHYGNCWRRAGPDQAGGGPRGSEVPKGSPVSLSRR